MATFRCCGPPYLSDSRTFWAFDGLFAFAYRAVSHSILQSRWIILNSKPATTKLKIGHLASKPATTCCRPWIGPDLSADDNALCGNRDITFDGDPDRTNFEGTCNKNDVRAYFCAHDRE